MLKQTAKKKSPAMKEAGKALNNITYIYERKALNNNDKALIEDCKPTNTKGNTMKTIVLKVNRIKNTLMSKIDKMFESIGYYFKGFKCDIEQGGYLVEVKGNSLILENKDGFQGDYIRGQQYTDVSPKDCWVD